VSASWVPVIESRSSLVGCLIVLVGLAYGLTSWAWSTHVHQQNAANQIPVVATIVKHSFAKELTGGAIYQLPIPHEVFVLETLAAFTLQGARGACVIKSRFPSEADRSMFLRTNAGAIGSAKSIFLSRNLSGPSTCRFEAYPPIDATDWAVIGSAGVLLAALSALYAIGAARLLRRPAKGQREVVSRPINDSLP